MKVVIATTHCGFTPSPVLVQKYLDRKGKECHVYELIDKTVAAWVPTDIYHHGLIFIFTKYYGPKVDLGIVNDEDHFNPFWWEKQYRTDPDFIAAVESMTEQEIAAERSTYKVVEIPDDVQWQLESDEGIEWIAEKHRTWK